MGHHKDNQASGQQLPSQHLEPPQQAPHKHAPLQLHQAAVSEEVVAVPLVDTLQHNIHQAEIEQPTNIATQRSKHPHSTPVLSPAAQGYGGRYRQEMCQCQQATRYSGIAGLFPPQVMDNGRFSQPTPYKEAGNNLMNALEGYSSQLVLTQSMMNSIQEFNGTDREATIL